MVRIQNDKKASARQGREMANRYPIYYFLIISIIAAGEERPAEMYFANPLKLHYFCTA